MDVMEIVARINAENRNRLKKDACDNCIKRIRESLSDEQMEIAKELRLFELLEQAFYKGTEGVVFAGKKE